MDCQRLSPFLDTHSVTNKPEETQETSCSTDPAPTVPLKGVDPSVAKGNFSDTVLTVGPQIGQPMQNMANKLMSNTESSAIKPAGSSVVNPVHSSPSSRKSKGLMQGQKSGFP